METLEFLPFWIWPLIASLCFLGLVALVYRFILQRMRMNRLRAVMKHNWIAYVEALSDTFKRLKSLRAALAQVRPRPNEQDLAEINKLLFEKVSAEIKILDRKLKEMAVASDREWQTMPVEYVPMIELHDEISRFIVLAQQGISDEAFEKLKAQWEGEFSKKGREKIKSLEKDSRALTVELENLKEQLTNLKSVKRGASQDKEAAARLMGELSDSSTLEEIEMKLTVVEGDIKSAEKKLIEGDHEGDRPLLSANLKWTKQTRRWWKTLLKLRKKTILLDEATGKAMSEDGDAEKMEGIKEFQEVEAKNAELNKKITELSATNLRLTRQLDQLNTESMESGALKEQHARAEQGRKTAERELENLETMLKDMENNLKKVNAENQRNKDLAEKLEENEELLKKQKNRVSELETESTKMEMTIQSLEESHKSKVKELDSEFTKLSEDIKEGNIEGMVPEAEVMELQAEYDKLNAEVMRLKGAVKQTERSEAEAVEEKDKLERESRSILIKYKELKKSTSDGMVPEAEVLELQAEYDKLNAKVMNYKSAVKQAEQNEAEAVKENKKMELQQRELLMKYKALLQKPQ